MSILNSIDWTISPEIFEFKGIQIRYYGLLFALGFILSFNIVSKFYKDVKLNISEVDKLTIYTIIGTILGARLGHFIFYQPEILLNHPLEILKIWQGGLASHGGALGILISTYFYSKKYERSYLWVLDRIVIPTALTGALIRVGNLFNSEIYGTETDLPWGFIFHQNGETIAKHPTQIYEAIFYFIIFVLMMSIYKKSKQKIKHGKMLGIFLSTVFLFRFFIEFIKNDQVHIESDMILNIGQLLSIPLFIGGIALILFSKNQKTDYKKTIYE